MLEEDPAKITVHLVQFEKYGPFCVPGAEGTKFCKSTGIGVGLVTSCNGKAQAASGRRHLRDRRDQSPDDDSESTGDSPSSDQL